MTIETGIPVSPSRERGDTSVEIRKRRSPLKKRAKTFGFHTLAGGISILWFLPILLILVTSFRLYSDILRNGVASAPESLTLGNYPTAWKDAGMAQAILNSFTITIPVVVLTLLLASVAAFGLSRYQIRARRFLVLLMLAGNLLPVQLMLIPWQKIAEGLGLFDSFSIVIAIQIAAGTGFYTFVLYGFMRAIPTELQDAASIDGAGPIRIYWQIILPLCRPALAALSALAFTWIFNDLVVSITLLRTSTKLPITAGVLSLLGEYSAEWNIISASTVIAAIPCVIVFMISQKSFISGLALGAVK